MWSKKTSLWSKNINAHFPSNLRSKKNQYTLPKFFLAPYHKLLRSSLNTQNNQNLQEWINKKLFQCFLKSANEYLHQRNNSIQLKKNLSWCLICQKLLNKQILSIVNGMSLEMEWVKLIFNRIWTTGRVAERKNMRNLQRLKLHLLSMMMSKS
mgnify:CR=1 FL=1